MKIFIAALSLCAGLGGCAGIHLTPEVPTRGEAAPIDLETVVLQDSSVSGRIRLDLNRTLGALDLELGEDPISHPERASDPDREAADGDQADGEEESWIDLGDDLRARLRLRATEGAQVRVEGDTVVLELPLAMSAIVAVPQSGRRPDQLVSCGCDGAAWCGEEQEPRRAIARLRTTLRIDEHWHFGTLTEVSVEAVDRCTISRGRRQTEVDLTNRLLEPVEAALEQTRTRFDEALWNFEMLERSVRQLWDALASPLEAEDGAAVRLRPRDVTVGALSGEGSELLVPLRFNIRPLMIERGGEGPSPRSLPAPSDEPAGEGFRIAASLEVSRESMSATLTEALRGQRFPRRGRGHYIRVDEVEAYGAGGQLVIRLGIGGDARGDIYLRGRLRLDAQEGLVRAEEIAFDAPSERMVVRRLFDDIEYPDTRVRRRPWFDRDQIRQAVEEACVFSIREQVEVYDRRLREALNRDMPRNRRLRARVDDPVFTNVSIDGETLRVLGIFVGELELLRRDEASPSPGEPSPASEVYPQLGPARQGG